MEFTAFVYLASAREAYTTKSDLLFRFCPISKHGVCRSRPPTLSCMSMWATGRSNHEVRATSRNLEILPALRPQFL